MSVSCVPCAMFTCFLPCNMWTCEGEKPTIHTVYTPEVLWCWVSHTLTKVQLKHERGWETGQSTFGMEELGRISQSGRNYLEIINIVTNTYHGLGSLSHRWYNSKLLRQKSCFINSIGQGRRHVNKDVFQMGLCAMEKEGEGKGELGRGTFALFL